MNINTALTTQTMMKHDKHPHQPANIQRTNTIKRRNPNLKRKKNIGQRHDQTTFNIPTKEQKGIPRQHH